MPPLWNFIGGALRAMRQRSPLRSYHNTILEISLQSYLAHVDAGITR
jgi:hypothetical protein